MPPLEERVEYPYQNIRVIIPKPRHVAEANSVSDQELPMGRW